MVKFIKTGFVASNVDDIGHDVFDWKADDYDDGGPREDFAPRVVCTGCGMYQKDFERCPHCGSTGKKTLAEFNSEKK